MDVLERCGISLRLSFLKIWAAKYRTALNGREGNRCPRSAFRTSCRSRRAKWLSGPTVAPRSALPTAFRVVLKLLVVEEKLFSSRKRKFGPAIDARHVFINKIHTTFRISGDARERVRSHDYVEVRLRRACEIMEPGSIADREK